MERKHRTATRGRARTASSRRGWKRPSRPPTRPPPPSRCITSSRTRSAEASTCAAAEPRRSVRRVDRDARARTVSRQSRRALSSRRSDFGQAPLGLAAMDLLRAAFKGRRHPVWRDRYTALFFLDEPTAFAAGHRPCFECRRADAKAFAEKWAQAKGGDVPRAPAMDRGASERTARWPREADARSRVRRFARRRVRCAEDVALCGARLTSLALERERLRREDRASARHRDRSHAAEHRRCSRSRLSAAMASERGQL